MFPKDYDFYIVNDGLGKRRSMLRASLPHRRSSSSGDTRPSHAKPAVKAQFLEKSAAVTQATNTDRSVEEEGTDQPISALSMTASQPPFEDTAVAGLTDSLSSLSFVPPSARFGRGRRGFARR